MSTNANPSNEPGGCTVHVHKRAACVAHDEDMRAVGTAFAEVLVPTLAAVKGIELLLSKCRACVSPIPPDACVLLQQDLDVVAGGAFAPQLAEYGITPLLIVKAADAIGMLLERAIDAAYFRPDSLLLFRRTKNGEVKKVTSGRLQKGIDRSDLVTEICTMAVLEKSAGEVLLDWLVEVAPQVKELFSPFDAECTKYNNIGLWMRRPAVMERDLRERWSASQK